MVNRPKPPSRSQSPKRPIRPRKKRELPDIHLGMWLDRLSREQSEVATAAKVGKSYVSHIVSGKKRNPASEKMLLISRALGVTVNDLYEPPPPRGNIDDMRRFSPQAIEKLLERDR